MVPLPSAYHSPFEVPGGGGIPATRGHKNEPSPLLFHEQITADDKEDISISIGGTPGPGRCGTGRGRNGNGLQAKKQTVQREKRGEERREESWKKMTERMKEGRDRNGKLKSECLVRDANS